MRHIGLSVLLCLVLSACAHGEILSLWNFNDAVSGTSGGIKEFLVDRGSGIMTSDFNPSNVGNTAGTSLNSQGDDPAGRSLVLSGSANNERNLTWMVNTEGFDSIAVSFAGQRTSTGFNNNEFLYTVDSGISWTGFGYFTPGTAFGLQSFDLSGIIGLNNNPNAGFRIVFSGASGSAGNNKLDNLLVSGLPFVPPDTSPVPEPSTIGLTVSGILLCILFGFRRRI
jgi:hypothetical protein